MSSAGTKILPSARISKENLQKLIRETEKNSEVTYYIKALSFSIYCKHRFQSSHLYGHSKNEIANKLNISRNSFSRLLTLASSLGLITTPQKGENNNRKSERLNYRLEKVNGSGANILIKLSEDDTLKTIEKKIFDAYYKVFFINRSETADKVKSHVLKWNRKRSGEIKSITGLVNPSRKLLSLVNNLCGEIRERDMNNSEAEAFLDSKLEAIFMTITINGIQSSLSISKNRIYKCKKRSNILTVRNYVILNQPNWTKAETDYYRENFNRFVGWSYIGGGSREVIAVAPNSYRLMFKPREMQKMVYNPKRARAIYGGGK